MRVGIIGGEDGDLWKVVAAQNGVTLKTVFNDYTQLNEALERGDIEANAFQHKPYLDNQVRTRGYHITSGQHQLIRPDAGRGSHRAGAEFNRVRSLKLENWLGWPA